MRHNGFFGIGVHNPKTAINTGTLFRTAQIFDCSVCATIGKRYERQNSDTMNASGHIPFFNYKDFDDFYRNLPYGTQLIGVELTEKAEYVETFKHPKKAFYLLGAEDNGLPKSILDRCHKVIKMRGKRSMNVAVAGSIIIYDRISKEPTKQEGNGE